METTNSDEPKQKSVSQKRPFWPSTSLGKYVVGLFVVYLLSKTILINIFIKVPFLELIILLGLLICSGLAVRKKEKSISVLIALVISVIAVAFSLLFILGEVLIGHE